MKRQHGVVARLCLLILGGPLLFSSIAYAIGTIQLDTSSFLNSSSTRPANSATFVLKADYQRQFKWVETALEPSIYLFLNDFSSFTPEAKNLYLATSSKQNPIHQFTFGRRNYGLSQVDQYWKLGLWSPRFLWDPLKPELVGFTGFFHTYQSGFIQTTAFVTALHIPERGAKIKERDGKLISASPFAVPMAERAEVLAGREVPIHYKIDQPKITKLLFHPGAFASARFGEKEGIWGRASYAYMPIQSLDIPVDFGLSLSDDAVNVNLHPRVLYHQMYTAEAGYQKELGEFWVSATREIPNTGRAPSNWITKPIGPAWIVSSGGALVWQNLLRLHTSYLLINEKAPASSASVQIPLPGRFAYSNAWTIGAQVLAIHSVLLGATFIADLSTLSRMASLDTQYTPTPQWKFGLGADVITSETSKGWFGKYRGESRGLLRVAYAF